MAKYFLATQNKNKIKEISGILGSGISIMTIQELAEVPDIEETENQLEGNALLKAKAFFKLTGLPCIADDTGLEVKALNGEPGVYSARYAGEEGNSEKNMDLLLKNLENSEDRSARFRTAICLYDGIKEILFEGILEGEITHSRVGRQGFGYDPIFRPLNSGKTLAEYSVEEKNAISHRGRAIRKLKDYLINGNK